MLTLPVVLGFTFILGVVTGAVIAIAAVVVAARLTSRLTSGRATNILTGAQEPLPFVIKDDARERQIEDENLGYKQYEHFDNLEGLGR